jgi:hypothetical protein
VNQRRYIAYRSLVVELDEWRATRGLQPAAHEELSDAAEGMLLARAGRDADEPLARASTTVLGMLALDELDQDRAAWVLDALLACGPPISQPLTEAA